MGNVYSFFSNNGCTKQKRCFEWAFRFGFTWQHGNKVVCFWETVRVNACVYCECFQHGVMEDEEGLLAPRCSDWMSDLPQGLWDIPLWNLAIPGMYVGRLWNQKLMWPFKLHRRALFSADLLPHWVSRERFDMTALVNNSRDTSLKCSALHEVNF